MVSRKHCEEIRRPTHYCFFARLTSIFSFLSAVRDSSQFSIWPCITLLETARVHMKDKMAILSAGGSV
jgi:hypothetical protein